MKNLFLFLFLAVFFTSCKKDKAITAANESVMANSYIFDPSQAQQIRVILHWAAYSNFDVCLTGYSYCWEIIINSSERTSIDKKSKKPKDYVAINEKAK